MKKLLLIALLALSANVFSQSIEVTKETFKGEWPFTVNQGYLQCEMDGKWSRIYFYTNETKYALNGLASKRGKSIDPIWKDNLKYGDLGIKVSISDMIKKGLEICK